MQRAQRRRRTDERDTLCKDACPLTAKRARPAPHLNNRRQQTVTEPGGGNSRTWWAAPKQNNLVGHVSQRKPQDGIKIKKDAAHENLGYCMHAKVVPTGVCFRFLDRNQVEHRTRNHFLPGVGIDRSPGKCIRTKTQGTEWEPGRWSLHHHSWAARLSLRVFSLGGERAIRLVLSG